MNHSKRAGDEHGTRYISEKSEVIHREGPQSWGLQCQEVGQEPGEIREWESEGDGRHCGKTLKACFADRSQNSWAKMGIHSASITNLERSLEPIKPRRFLKCQSKVRINQWGLSSTIFFFNLVICTEHTTQRHLSGLIPGPV